MMSDKKEVKDVPKLAEMADRMAKTMQMTNELTNSIATSVHRLNIVGDEKCEEKGSTKDPDCFTQVYAVQEKNLNEINNRLRIINERLKDLV